MDTSLIQGWMPSISLAASCAERGGERRPNREKETNDKKRRFRRDGRVAWPW